MTELRELRPYAVAEVEYEARDIGYGSEEGTFTGYFTGDVDTWGKATFHLVDPILRDNMDKLYLFSDELVSVSYLDEQVSVNG
jgi:hypothetical protein